MEKKRIRHNDLELSGTLGITRIEKLKIENIPGNHAKLELEGIIEDIEEIQKWENVREDYFVSIYHKEILIFYGVILNAHYFEENGVFRGKMLANALSVKFDMQKESHSFQDIDKTYIEIIEQTLLAADGECYSDGTYVGKPEKPVIQYRETDWEFAKRMASRIGTTICSDPTIMYPFVWVGMPANMQIDIKFSEIEYIHGINNTYLIGNEKVIHSGCEYYKVKSYEPLAIGNVVNFKNKSWYIVEVFGELCKEEFIYTYTLSKKDYVFRKRFDNQAFAGLSLLGQVIYSESELLKIKFEMDQEITGKEYLYEWAPDTGSIMYCMPEIGSKVSVYFANTSEESARVVNCVRNNQVECLGYEDISKRSFTTLHDKMMYLYRTTMGFDGGENGQLMALGDETGVMLGSNQEISMHAVKGITFQGGKISFYAPKEITIQRG